MNEVAMNLPKNEDTISNLKRAVEEAGHYILMGTDTFSIRIGDIMIRKVKNE